MNRSFLMAWDSRDRRVPLTVREVAVASFALVALAFVLGLFAGRASQTSSGQPVFAELRTQLESQKAEVDAIREVSGRSHDALAARLGQLSAHIIRLDALGQRLVGMAGLADGEFNFGEEPALGGPEILDQAASLQSGEITALLDELEQQIHNRARQLDILEALMFNRRLTEAASIEGRPIRSGWVSSGYGYRTDPFTGKRTFHSGMDFVSPKGSDVLAVAAGVVTFSGRMANYGNLVEIDHGNGRVTRYGHNLKNLVAVGDKVQKGETIALVGSTGRSTAPHVHFEVMDNGRTVNPRQFIR